MKNHGFTLIEMIVSLAIFSVVAVIAIGALLKVIDSNNKAQSIESSVTNLNFALESMSRELRTGTNIQCYNGPFTPAADLSSSSVTPCNIGHGQSIAFYSTRSNSGDSPACPHGLITAYAFVAQSDGTYVLQKAEQASCGSSAYGFADLVSAADMKITGYELGVLYTSPGYPLAFIRIAGYAGAKTQTQTFVDVETAVSARTQQ